MRIDPNYILDITLRATAKAIPKNNAAFNNITERPNLDFVRPFSSCLLSELSPKLALCPEDAIFALIDG